MTAPCYAIRLVWLLLAATWLTACGGTVTSTHPAANGDEPARSEPADRRRSAAASAAVRSSAPRPRAASSGPSTSTSGTEPRIRSTAASLRGTLVR